MATPSLKEYLKRYETPTSDPKSTTTTNKKKKKKNPKPASLGVLVVDEDPVWQKPIQTDDPNESDDDSGNEAQIEEDIEVKRMKRLELIRTRKPYHAISDDGSGWVSVSDQAKVGEDLSPPRQRRKRFDTPSPERKEGGDEGGDLSPPRQRRRPVDDDDDMSPPRRRRDESVAAKDGDLSPPRRKREASSTVKETRRTGLLTGAEVKKDIEKIKKEEHKKFASMDASMSGRGAEAVFRDKQGKRISKEELLKSQEEEKPKEKKLEWGKGLAQKREAEAREQELELEKDKPFARTRDDPELDKLLKERVRWGDPMAHLVKRKSSELLLEDLGDDEKMKESGFIIPQTIPSHSWIKRGIECLPNRYGIRPGRHWDGVDRSNGYEKEFFQRQNEKRATESEAYLWSVADM